MMTKRVSRKAHTLRSELYRGLVLEAAEEEFACHGFRGARMVRVAAEIGLSVGTIYNLFESKERLYETILTLRGSALMERLLAALAVDAPVLTRFGAAVRAHVSFSVEHPNFLRISMRRGKLWSNSDEHNLGIEAPFLERGVAAAVALCRVAIERGELLEDDPRRMVLSLSALHQAHLESWLDGGMTEAPEAVSNRIIDLFGRMYTK